MPFTLLVQPTAPQPSGPTTPEADSTAPTIPQPFGGTGAYISAVNASNTTKVKFTLSGSGTGAAAQQMSTNQGAFGGSLLIANGFQEYLSQPQTGTNTYCWGVLGAQGSTPVYYPNVSVTVTPKNQPTFPYRLGAPPPILNPGDKATATYTNGTDSVTIQIDVAEGK